MQSSIKQILDLNKKAFDDSFKAIMTVQEHAEKMTRMFCEQCSFFPTEGKRVIEEWIINYKNGLEQYRSNVDQRFAHAEEYLLNAARQMESSLGTMLKGFPGQTAADVSGGEAGEVKKVVPRKSAARKVNPNRKKSTK